MMQTAELGHRYNPVAATEIHLRFTAGRRSLRQRKMRSVLVVVTDVLVHQAFQMPFIQNDRMVEQITAAVANPTLSDTVLPRASEAGPLGLDAEAFYGCASPKFRPPVFS
jgi:hypothetical protein